MGHGPRAEDRRLARRPVGYGAGGGSGQLVIEIHAPAEAAALGPQFMTALANGIRVRGGDPRILTRKVVLA